MLWDRRLIVFLSFTLNCLLLFHLAINYSKSFKYVESKANTIQSSFPLCNKFDQFSRLQNGDLSYNLVSINDFKDEVYEWDICKSYQLSNLTISNSISNNDELTNERITYCEFNPLLEQKYQLKFFKRESTSCTEKMPDCAVLPPKDYRWPQKHVTFPTPSDQVAVPWANLGLSSWDDLSAFNPNHKKNMIHFNASYYDVQQEKDVNLAAQYIPFGKKIRTILEIGAGGGSISFILSKRYDVTVLNTAFSDFPYCEYITERGGLCLLLDGQRVMPFAKFSFDTIHHSWVYHSLSPTRWGDVLLEQKRILRPGGYLWICDGLSTVQLKAIKYLLLKQLGYVVLFEKEKSRSIITAKFGSNPYELDWIAILVKPNHLKQDLRECSYLSSSKFLGA